MKESSVEDLLAEINLLRGQVRELQARRDQMYTDMLLWRGIETEHGDIPCKKCNGSGVRGYGDTTTWRGGIGGQVITSDICDSCWGSGQENKPWLNLRRIRTA